MPQTDGEADERASPVRVVSLGSRKQLCINKPLIDSGGDLDEKCRELLTSSFWLHFLMFSADSTKKNLALGVNSFRHERMRRRFLNLGTKFWYRHLALSA